MKGLLLLAALGIVAAIVLGILLFAVFGDGLSPEESPAAPVATAPRGTGLDPGPKPRLSAERRTAAPAPRTTDETDAEPKEDAVDLDARFPVADCIDPPRPTESGELDPKSERALIGRVVDPDGLGVAAARVVAMPRGNPNERVETTSAIDGTFRVVVASADEDRDIEVSHAEFGRKTFRIRPSRRGEGGIEVPIGDLVLERAGSISGFVQIAGGAPGSGLEVILNGPLAGVAPATELVSPGYQFALLRAKPDGSFAFESLAPGRYSIEVHPGAGRGLADVELEVELASGQELRDVTLLLRPTGQVEITVTDANGVPVPGLGVGIELLEAASEAGAGAGTRRPGSLTAATDADGRATFSNATPGRYKATIDNQGARTAEGSPSEFEISEGSGTVRLSITVRRSESISGCVVDGDGEGVQSLAVVATSTSHADDVSQVRTALTGPNGEFIISGLLEVEYRLDVMDLAAAPESQTLATRDGVAAGTKDVELAVLR